MKKSKSMLLIVSAAMLLSACTVIEPTSSQPSSSQTPSSSSVVPSSSAEPSSSAASSSELSSSSEESSSTPSSSSSQIQKATIVVPTLTHATTSLKSGEYELNKAIEFTVAIDTDYQIIEVKVNDAILTAKDGNYSFTPTEEKTYTLSVTTQEIIKKATIALGTIDHATTTLKAGDYELNKAIVFNVTADDEYKITGIKINDVTVPAVQGGYSFTPTEQKTYTLTVTTEEIENLVVFNFNDGENLTHKGIQIDPNTLNPEEFPEIKDGVITLKEGMRIVVNCRAVGTKDVWMRKITFVFKEGSDKFAPIEEEDKQKYKDGVWTETMVDRTDRGTANLPCLASGKVVIDKIIVETVPFAAYKTKITFTGLEDDEKIYIAKETTQKGYDQRIEYKLDMEFTLSEFYYFVVASNAKHKKYYELPDIVNDKDSGLSYTDTYIEESSTNQQVHVRFYRIDIPEDIVESIPLTVKWVGKNAVSSLRFDDVSGNKYAKGYMETNPMESLDIQDGDVVYGKEIKLFSLRPKNGYRDLKLIINGKEVEPTEDEQGRVYKFVVEEKDENTIGFTATEGEDPQITKVNISEKGYLYGAELDGFFNFEFQQAEDHPSAKLETLKFNDVIVEGKEIDEHIRYILSAEQTATFKAAADKVALFANSVITEGHPYQTAVNINKGSYTVKVEFYNTSTSAYEEVQGEPTPKSTNYDLTGGVNMRVTITPNANLYIFAIDLNDVRLKNTDYTVDPNTGVVTYTRTADRLSLDFLVQTKNQTVTITPTITEGFKVEGLESPVNIGNKVALKLAPVDDSHWLEGKKITVTYNGAEIPVDTTTFTFEITPIKDVTALNVTIEDAPQE